MSRPRPKISKLKLRRPDLETMFHIDFEWWEESNLDLKTYLLSRLDVGDELSLDLDVDYVDLVDLETGEVRKRKKSGRVHRGALRLQAFRP